MSNYNKILPLVLLITSCLSTRHIPVVPATEAYRTQGVMQELVPAVPASPVITAALPTKATRYKAEEVYGEHTSHISVPDTTTKVMAPSASSVKSDPTITVVKSVGGVVSAVGIGIIIDNSGKAPATEWGGLTQFIGLMTGVIVLLAGLRLLYFQSKYDRLRRLREARKEASLPKSAKLSAHTILKRKAGLHLMVTGGVLGLLWILISGYTVLLLPISAILLLVGAVFSITSY